MSMLSIVLLALFAVLANPFVGAQVVPPPAPPSPPPPPASLNAAITQFAPKLFSDIGREFCCDLVISPFSAFEAVVLLSQGAIGSVYQQLVSGLGISNDKTVVANQVQNYNQELQQIARSAEIITANQIFVQNNFQLESTFQNVATQQFLAGIQQTDYSNVASIDLINSYAKRQTHSMIENVVVENAGMISSNTRVVAVNSIYFGGSFNHRFNKNDSFEGLFNGSDQIGFMTTTETYNHAVLPDLGATAIEMEYVNSNLTLVVVLPTKNNLNKLLAKLQNYDWNKITSQMQPKTVKVTLPKFGASAQVSLNTYLNDLGMGEMFQSSANMSIPLLNPTIPLIITNIHHTSAIRVDECETELASGTGDISTTFVLAATPIINPAIPFHANRPFVYFLRDRVENTILFSGYVKKPTPPATECSQQSEG